MPEQFKIHHSLFIMWTVHHCSFFFPMSFIKTQVRCSVISVQSLLSPGFPNGTLALAEERKMMKIRKYLEEFLFGVNQVR